MKVNNLIFKKYTSGYSTVVEIYDTISKKKIYASKDFIGQNRTNYISKSILSVNHNFFEEIIQVVPINVDDEIQQHYTLYDKDKSFFGRLAQMINFTVNITSSYEKSVLSIDKNVRKILEIDPIYEDLCIYFYWK